MNATSAGCGIRTDGSVRLAWMVEDERDQVTWRKTVLDWDSPEHMKRLSFDELGEIARLKVMEKLCRPPETAEEILMAEQGFDWFGMQIAQ